jgi:hypothetical protein
MYNEARFKMVEAMNPQNAKEYAQTAQNHADAQYKKYMHLANLDYSEKTEEEL